MSSGVGGLRIGHVMVCAFALFAGGCTIVTSETFDQIKADGRAPRGVQYALPRGTVKATLTVDPETLGFTLSLDQGEMVPDPDNQYVLRYRPHPSYDDDILVNTNSKGLLTKVHSTTTDKTPQIIMNIAKALSYFGALEATQQSKTQQTLYERSFDPLVPEARAAVVQEINRRVVGFIASSREACAHAGAEDSTAAENLRLVEDQLKVQRPITAKRGEEKKVTDAAVKGALDALTKSAEQLDVADLKCDAKARTPAPEAVRRACEMLARQRSLDALYSDAVTKQTTLENAKSTLEAQQKPRVEVCAALDQLAKKPPKASISLPDFAVDELPLSHQGAHAAANGAPEADCSIGICYRPPVPVTIKYSLGAGDSSLVADLPNPSAVVAIDIRRAFFIKKVQQIDFDQGMLTKLHIQKNSELVAISKLPVDIISAIADGIQLRAKITTEQKNVLEKQAALLNAQAQLAEARSGAAQPGVEAATARGTVPPARRGAASRPVLP